MHQKAFLGAYAGTLMHKYWSGVGRNPGQLAIFLPHCLDFVLPAFDCIYELEDFVGVDVDTAVFASSLVHSAIRVQQQQQAVEQG